MQKHIDGPFLTRPKLLAVCAFFAAFCLVAVKYDLFARLLFLMLSLKEPEHGYFDEYIAFILFLLLGNGLFALGKYRDLARECARRERAEAALRESEERFRLVFEQSTEATALIEPATGRFLFLNAAMEELLGYRRAELLAEGAPLLYRHFAAEGLEGICAGDALPPDFLSTRVKSRHRDGTPLVLSLRVRSVVICGNHLLHLTLRDMTEKARYEQQTSEAQARLIHANKMSSLGLLVSGVAHEINNPNSFIMFNSAMLADIWQDADRILAEHRRLAGDFAIGGLAYPEIGTATAKLIHGIQEGAQRIKATVDNLKDFARQDDPALDRPLDLNQAVLKAVSIMTPQIKKLCGNFTLELAEELPETHGSAQQIEQVVINLLSNALQALPDRERAVSLVTARSAEGGLEVTVRDAGTGMRPETLKRLSEPFFTTKSTGTGLGLYISHSIVKEHGGSLHFHSLPGQGTAVTLRLPLNAQKGGRL